MQQKNRYATKNGFLDTGESIFFGYACEGLRILRKVSIYFGYFLMFQRIHFFFWIRL